jgi:hypothetical protein
VSGQPGVAPAVTARALILALPLGLGGLLTAATQFALQRYASPSDLAIGDAVTTIVEPHLLALGFAVPLAIFLSRRTFGEASRRGVYLSAIAILPLAAALMFAALAISAAAAPLMLLAAVLVPASLPAPRLAGRRVPGAVLAAGMLLVAASSLLLLRGDVMAGDRDSAIVGTPLAWPPPADFELFAPRRLDPGPAFVVRGSYRDFELRAEFMPHPGGVFETRFRAATDAPRGSTLRIGGDPRVAIQIAREDERGYSPLGAGLGLPIPGRRLELRLRVTGDVAQAWLADPGDRAMPRFEFPPVSGTGLVDGMGDIVFLATRGEVDLHRLEIEALPPVEEAEEPPDLRRSPRAAIWALGALVLLAAAARGGRRAAFDALSAIGFALAPIAVFLSFAGDAAESTYHRAACVTALLGTPAAALAGYVRGVGARLLAVLLCAAFSLAIWLDQAPDDSRSALFAGGRFDHPARRIEPDLALLEHAAFRRGHDYLVWHRFAGEEADVAARPGRRALFLTGERAVYTADSSSTAPGAFAQRLEERLGSSEYDVLDATQKGATYESTAALIETVLLAPYQDPFATKPPRRPGFAPIAIVVTLAPEPGSLLGPPDWIAAQASSSRFRTALDRFADEVVVIAGGNAVAEDSAPAIAAGWLARIATIAERAGSRVVVLSPPAATSRDRAAAETIAAALAPWIARGTLHFVGPEFLAAAEAAPPIVGADGAVTPHGRRVAADLLAPRLEELLGKRSGEPR